MKLSADLISFQNRLGYTFDDPSLLTEAVTHSSMSSQTRRDNQRLEFLGDRVLGLIIAHALFEKYIEAKEGILAPRFNTLVRKETCAEVAQQIDLGSVLKLGRSEMVSGGRRKEALLGDAMEAIIAAIYIDGGLGTAEKTILTLWGQHIEAVKSDARDAKTALQEWAQARGLKPPIYETMSRKGPDHAPIFEIEVCLETGEKQQASAGTKRKAEQAAANALLQDLGATE